MLNKRGLGRGFESLLPPAQTAPNNASENTNPLQTVPIENIVPNRLQPRTIFDDDKIRELANSIKEDGILQPLIVSPPTNGRYELIAGERRLRASRLAGLAEVPVVIKDVDQTTTLVLSLIENIQRQDLNPIEEAVSYNELIENFNLTQDEVAKRIGKSRVAVANTLRLLNLPQTIKDDVSAGRYSPGHARALLAANGVQEQLKLREWIIKHTPTVRNVEERINIAKQTSNTAQNKTNSVSPQINTVLEKMRQTLGTKVKISTNRKGGGKITIDYYSWQELDNIYRRVTGG
ncbi:MAG: ParB/RepB/Spo0J family partition protein [Pseudomonadota bacterium]